MLPIYALTPFTMLDYEEHTSCIVWFAGCNFRCPYCHNPDMVRGKGSKSVEEIMEFLKKRQGKLEAVVLSGGECTSFAGLADFARQAKSLGYKVKMDTNGTRPKVVKQMVKEGLVDFIALDYKAPEEKFYSVTHSHKWADFQETLAFLCEQNKVKYEVRTTVHRDILNEADIAKIRHDLAEKGYNNTYYVQNFMDREGGILGDLCEQIKPLDIATIAASSTQAHQSNQAQASTIAPISQSCKKIKVEFRNF